MAVPNKYKTIGDYYKLGYYHPGLSDSSMCGCGQKTAVYCLTARNHQTYIVLYCSVLQLLFFERCLQIG